MLLPFLSQAFCGNYRPQQLQSREEAR
jgi:hypothetical protein